MEFDWQKIVDMNPRGYVEVQHPSTRTVIHGPIESVTIGDNDTVVIKLKWAAIMGIPGTPSFGEWKAAPEGADLITFPNFLVPFRLEETPEKGERVIFHHTNILYIDEQRGLDPAKVEGLELPTS